MPRVPLVLQHREAGGAGGVTRGSESQDSELTVSFPLLPVVNRKSAG